MSIHILVDGVVRARSRFAFSPAFEVLGAIRSRGSTPVTPTGAVHHVARWNERARCAVDPATRELLHALYPVDHEYTPDFLTPRPTGARESIEQVLEAIASTPEETVEHHLDIALDGRAVRPEVAEQFPSEEAYRAWRRPVPPALARLVDAGPRAVAEESARAIGAWFSAAMAGEWPDVRVVLEADIAHRGAQISSRGWAAMLADLGDLTWTGTELLVERPYEGVVDWADDGVLFVPSAAHSGRVQFCAERPDSPVMTYTARGTAALWSRPRESGGAGTDVMGLVGRGRSEILVRLDRPRTTRDLSRLDGRSESTISYHLGVLADAGLVARRRFGGSVAYRRTPLADSLVAAGRGTPEVDDG